MTTAVDKWPAAAELVAVAAAGHLPTAPTPPQGARPSLLTDRAQNDYQATITFTSLTNLFVSEIHLNTGVQRYKNAVYLFIDELDDLLRSPVKETRMINDTLRHLFDGCPNCFCMVIALSAEVS